MSYSIFKWLYITRNASIRAPLLKISLWDPRPFETHVYRLKSGKRGDLNLLPFEEGSANVQASSRCARVSHILLLHFERTPYPLFFFFFFSSSHFYFQLLDKPWSQVLSLLPPGSCLQFLSRIGFSNPTARRFFMECC